MSELQRASTSILNSISFHFPQDSNLPKWTLLAAAIALPATCGFAIARVLDDYHAWLAMGPGGLPANVFGYALNRLLTVTTAFKDTRSLAPYDQPEKYVAGWKQAEQWEVKSLETSYLPAPLPERQRPWASAKAFSIPQRERNADEWVDPEIRETYTTAISALVTSHSQRLEWRTSVMERRGAAVFLRDVSVPLVPSALKTTRGELAHVHASDLSAHVVLSFADAREVIRKGWGERHRMAGTKRMPLGYTLLHVPRRVEEVETLVAIFEAGVGYACVGA